MNEEFDSDNFFEQLNAKAYKELNYQQDREYKNISMLIEILCNMCAGSPNKVIDLLTGCLWDEEEAENIKISNFKQ